MNGTLIDTPRTVLESRESALAAVESMAELVRESAQRAEDERTLPDDIVDAFETAGLWGVFTARTCGGSGLGSLLDLYDIVRAMAYEDTSAAWALFISGCTPMIVASRLPADGRDEVFRDGVKPMAGSFVPSGQARAIEGGLVVSGRWSFGSGIHHAGWVMGNVVVNGDVAPSSPPDVRAVVVPPEEVCVIDDWHVAGLRGTGSMSFTMTDVFVPDRRTFPFYGPASTDELQYRLPLFTSVGAPFAALCVGYAQRAFDEVIRALPGRRRPPLFKPLSEEPTTHLTVGRAMASIRAAEQSTRALFSGYDARVANGEDFSLLSVAERAEIHQHVVWVAEICASAVDQLFRLGGASAIYEPGVLQRCWRDINVLLQHVYLSSSFHELAARNALGLPADAPNL